MSQMPIKTGRPPLPEGVKKEKITIRLRPWIKEFVRDKKINLSQIVEDALYALYGPEKIDEHKPDTAKS